MKTVNIITALLFVTLSIACSQTNSSYISIDGDIPKEVNLSSNEFSQLPRVSITTKSNDTYEGVDLKTLLKLTGMKLGSDLKGKDLNKFIVFKSPDGFKVVVALPEFDITYQNQTILIADKINSQPLNDSDGPLRAILVDDNRMGRWVKKLTQISIATYK